MDLYYRYHGLIHRGENPWTLVGEACQVAPAC